MRETHARRVAILDRREHRAQEQHETVGILVIRVRSPARPGPPGSRLILVIELRPSQDESRLGAVHVERDLGSCAHVVEREAIVEERG